MAELEENHEREFGWLRLTLTIFAATIVGNILQDLAGLPYWLGLLLGYFLAYTIDYWIPPRPSKSFLFWELNVLCFLFGIAMCLRFIPALLDLFLWTPLAYGIPSFLFLLAIYWTPPLYPPKRQDSFTGWLLFCLVFASVFGIGMYLAT
jgi:hypothetical protein